MRTNRRKRGYQIHQGTDFLKLQRADTAEEGHDVDRGAECSECAGDEEEKWIDRVPQKERRVGRHS